MPPPENNNNNGATLPYPIPRHQVVPLYDKLIDAASAARKLAGKRRGRSESTDEASQVPVSMDDPFVGPKVGPLAPQYDMRGVQWRMKRRVERRKEKMEFDEQVEVDRSRGVRPTPPYGAQDRLVRRAAARRQRMEVAEKAADAREVVTPAVDDRNERGEEEPERKKVRLSEGYKGTGKEHDGPASRTRNRKAAKKNGQ
ncbi:hypothetical protein BST61_g10325 [Cercospora zeina]